MEDKLKSLKELLDNGIISEEEYNAKKREFIPLSEEAKPKAVDKTPTFKQLKEWKALVEIGILTEEEFIEKKNELLGLTEPLNDQTDFNFDNDFQGSNDKGSLSLNINKVYPVSALR